MLLFRWLILLFLLAAGVNFALYIGTRDRKYLDFGWKVLKWTLIAAFGFFAVLIMERVG